MLFHSIHFFGVELVLQMTRLMLCNLVFVFPLLTGCGEAGPNVSGVLLKDGQPYKLEQGEQCSVSLVGENTYAGQVTPDGKFNFSQPIPAGKYKLTVAHIGDYSMTKSDPKAKSAPIKDKLNNVFGRDNTPLNVDVNGSTNLTVDLGTKTVTKK